MVQSEFTDKEVMFLIDILDWWQQGNQEAKGATIVDQSFTSLEDLLEVYDGYAEQDTILSSIREKLGVKRDRSAA